MKFFMFFCFLNIGLLSAFSQELGTPKKADIEYPDDQEPNKEMVELGRLLFFDNRLSKNQTQSCATCHNPDLGFSDGFKFGIGDKGGKVGRNAPHLYNLAWNKLMFWDGRAKSLEEQALGPIAAEGEMNMDFTELIARLEKVNWYKTNFKAVFKKDKIEKSKLEMQ